MSYATGVIPTPDGVLAYPTPFYESTLTMLILWVLLRAETHPDWQRPLKRCGLYLALIGSERFVIEFIRVNPTAYFGLSQAQLIYLLVAGIGAVLLAVPLVKVQE